jgi:hypothetical protein
MATQASLLKATKRESNAPLFNHELFDFFIRLVNKELNYSADTALYIKVGDLFNDTSFDFRLQPKNIHSIDQVCEIDDIKFVSDAMRDIRKYRILGDDVYRIRNKDDLEGNGSHNYLLTVNGNPGFIINQADAGSTMWQLSPLEFQSYDKRGSFIHTPTPDSAPLFEVGMEVSVQNQKKDKLFLKMYNSLIKLYTEKGFEEVKPQVA